jgi:hypothetical protein
VLARARGGCGRIKPGRLDGRPRDLSDHLASAWERGPALVAAPGPVDINALLDNYRASIVGGAWPVPPAIRQQGDEQG